MNKGYSGSKEHQSKNNKRPFQNKDLHINEGLWDAYDPTDPYYWSVYESR